MTLEELMDISVQTPAKLSQTIREAPVVGGVVTRDQIDSYGWISLNDVLYRQRASFPRRISSARS